MAIEHVNPGDKATASKINEIIGQVNANSKVAEMFFGDGSDGDVTISANCTINKIMYYNNLTIDSGVTVTSDKKALIIYVKNTLTNNGKISMTGKGAGGGGISDNYCYSPCSVNANGKNGGDGLISGGSGGNCGGSGGSGGAGDDAKLRALVNHIGYCEWCNFPNVGAGGGGGGGTASCSGDGTACYAYDLSGDGRAGGGAIYIFAKNIVNNGTIEAKGENGENGGSASGGSRKRAGGGGGAGGLIVLKYITKSGTGNIDVSGGNGGTGASGCENGQAGSDGKIFEV